MALSIREGVGAPPAGLRQHLRYALRPDSISEADAALDAWISPHSLRLRGLDTPLLLLIGTTAVVQHLDLVVCRTVSPAQNPVSGTRFCTQDLLLRGVSEHREVGAGGWSNVAVVGSFVRVLGVLVGGMTVGAAVFVVVYERTGVPEVECRDTFVGASAACAAPQPSLLPAAPLGLVAMAAAVAIAMLLRRSSTARAGVL